MIPLLVMWQSGSHKGKRKKIEEVSSFLLNVLFFTIATTEIEVEIWEFPLFIPIGSLCSKYLEKKRKPKMSIVSVYLQVYASGSADYYLSVKLWFS